MTTACAISGGALALALLPVVPGFASPGTDGYSPALPQAITDNMLSPVATAAASELSVGPGRAVFTFSPTGAWIRFGPREGRALISAGGFIVLARGENGGIATAIDTRTGGLHTLRGVRDLDKVYEGIVGGRRYPSSRSDDDGDGRVNEDRLDGTDNDGDGRIDEDFAAIGDEMVVTAYAPLRDVSAPLSAVEVYQESYAWSLRHIDGMVVTRITVRNTGERPIKDVRIGAAFEKRGDFAVDSEDFGEMDVSSPGLEYLLSRGMLLHNDDESVAVLFFAPPTAADGAASWLTGVARARRSVAALVEASQREDTPAPSDGPSGPVAGPAPQLRNGAETGESGHMAWGVSPSLGTLGPGEEAFVYIALVAPPSAEGTRRSVDYAWRTVTGDGNSRMIPPPVSIKRQVLWGMYELELSGDLVVTLLGPRSQGINPMEIAYLKGFDLGRAMRSELPDGNARLQYSGDLPEGFEERDRVILRGRMQDGEWFDAVLQPAVDPLGHETMSAQQYFNRPGKLDETLISGSPNPFRDATTIHYEVPARVTDEYGNQLEFSGAIDTSVKVYNVAGRLVSTLEESTRAPGQYQTSWSARNETGAAVASGVYYVKLQIGKRYITKRLIQLK